MLLFPWRFFPGPLISWYQGVPYCLYKCKEEATFARYKMYLDYKRQQLILMRQWSCYRHIKHGNSFPVPSVTVYINFLTYICAFLESQLFRSEGAANCVMFPIESSN